MKISILLFSLLVGICLALGIVLMTEEPEGAAGVAHPEFSSMLRGGDGAQRLAPVRLVSRAQGVLAGVTIGAPIGLRIINRDHTKWKGQAVPPMSVPRPGHADLSAALKYGYRDLRFSLERASARETAARVAVGAVCRKLWALPCSADFLYHRTALL